ncbi:MAG: SH3 domain-containing protein [Desulfarculaceae bacterium]|nr:SH3 domain-containing protein [Desulfarculaceae bacterium]MCF8073544.1 SH3 domain-containing protein [Desulfarculaceae bacterium]MCF8103066.1 SH3 domain-containing protein [Desulfarculaceae bacterium]MCF8115740.1 SH3 domain-containing protein [Desulfarculaceae bacterium]
MNSPSKTSRAALVLLLAALCLPLAALPASAQSGRGGGHGGGGGHGSGGRSSYNGPRHYDRMPQGYHRYDHRGKRWYGHGGRYYRPYRGGFVLAFPPVGLFVGGLPMGFRVILVGGLPYYFYGGVYYRPAPGGYVVVSAPVVTGTAPAAPSAPASGTVVVLAEALNLRSGPGMNYPVVAVLSQTTVLDLQGRSNGWLYVRAPGGQRGWVARQFTSDNNPPASG